MIEDSKPFRIFVWKCSVFNRTHEKFGRK